MRFEWDPKKASANLAKHSVSFQEAATLFGHALSVTFPDPHHSVQESRYITLGISEQDRILVVAHAERAHDIVRIISARKATRRERRFYEEGR